MVDKTGKLKFYIPVYTPWHSLIFNNFLLSFLVRPRLLASNAFLHITHAKPNFTYPLWWWWWWGGMELNQWGGVGN